MSGYSGLNDVSKTLAKFILNGMQGDKPITDIISSEDQISLLSPKEAETKSAKISIFLYSINEHPPMRNQPPLPQNPSKPPTLLFLNLHYLITPLTSNSDNDQLLLGKIMQLLSETPVLRGPILQGNLTGGSENFRVSLDIISIDDINKLWSVLGGQYKLSVSYSVLPVRIEATRELGKKLVVEAQIDYTEKK